jgi:hypothetical protein
VTVPDAPPAAGPDRALDPPPPGPIPPAALPGADCPAVEGGVVAVADEEVPVADEELARPNESPVTEQTSTTPRIQTLLLFASSRCTLGQRSCSSVDAAADWSGGGFDGEVGGATAPATGCSDAALDTGRLEKISSGPGDSQSFTVAFLS